MAARLRVFLVGRSSEDLTALRARVRSDANLDVAGEALESDIRSGRVRVPADVDAVLSRPDAPVAASHTQSAVDAPATRLFEELTARERDVLALLSDGLGNRAIADELGLSEHTVKFHLASIFGKLGASTRTEAVRKGLELGIIDL